VNAKKRLPNLYKMTKSWCLVNCWYNLRNQTCLKCCLYCASHILVQPSFRRYYFYSLPDTLKFSSIISTF